MSVQNSQGQQLHFTRPREWQWSFWPLVPIYPYSKRQTVRQEVIKDTIWTFDQQQGIFYVTVPIRMTIVRLEAGGLLVYAPVAPTTECIHLVRELEAQHGTVKYIILPTISGLEHKVFVGPFARRFPQAQVFVAPNQWSFPVNLPLSWLGFPIRRTQILPNDSTQAPFADEFDYSILGPIDLGLRPFEEVAFFHRRSHTLLLTDTIVSIPESPPAIVQLDPYPLLFHAKDDAFDDVDDSPATRRKGWQRISLFACYFRPSALEAVPLGQAIRESVYASDRSKKAYFGIFPFKWNKNWKHSFDILRGEGRPLVAPILQRLILNRAPQATLDWSYHVACWDFHRIIPCHFDAPIKATPHEFRQAFAFLEKTPTCLVSGNGYQPLPEEDLEILNELNDSLNKRGITPPAKEKV
ncbi:MAG: DUF4336 domain-containing protein [Elainellaceae cyanobacterium]